MQNGKPAVLALVFAVAASNGLAARLSPGAEQAFDSYVANLEARLARQHTRPETYLAVLPADPHQRNRLLSSGELYLEPVNGGTWHVGGALLHHWRGAALVPNATPRDMLALLRDFNHLSQHYAPQMVSSRALTDDRDTATLAVRFREQKLRTIVLDAEYQTEIKLSDSDRGYSISRSTHVWQVDNPGTPQERRRRPGEDDGFLWRLNSYWSFARASQGLHIECEAVSLTRDVPPGLGWLITPIIASYPREALAFSLRATSNALIANLSKEEN